ncbi:MAG: S8 family serine peptidase, partial [Betaproteobacteria bacterium]
MAEESDRPTGSPKSGRGQRARAEFKPVELTALYNSMLRMVLTWISSSDWSQLAYRTGIEWNGKAPQFLHLFIELDRGEMQRKNPEGLDLQRLLFDFELLVPSAYYEELAINPKLRTLPARIPLRSEDPSRTAKGNPLEAALQSISACEFVNRVRLAVPHGKCLERSLAAIDLPTRNDVQFQGLSGRDIVIGVIDDGCAFAHPDFLQPTTRATRVLTLWDQTPASANNDDITAGWTEVQDFGYGRELRNGAIDAALARHSSEQRVDEDAVYDELRYAVGTPGERATHGTKVMGIAAGNGSSLMGWPGVAPAADIIFVQLPPTAIRLTPKLLSTHIVDGAAYIFKRARELNKKAAVVNISYGGNSGPHDGTSAWEMALDELLAVDDRAIVVSAGNGFAANCHAGGKLKAGQERALRWILKPDDATGNDLEIWYGGDAEFHVWLTPPDGSAELGPFTFGANTNLLHAADGQLLGSIEHVKHDPNNGDNSIMIALGPTALSPDPSAPAVKAPRAKAPAGTWIVRLRNVGNKSAEYHGWIQRDDVGREGARQQSRFDADDADSHCTLADFATGNLTISAGAFNVATGEISTYSASGPTRASAGRPRRPKPDICAPAEELATGGGVLTTGSRQAPPRRMNGTSAAAPHVAGVVALA